MSALKSFLVTCLVLDVVASLHGVQAVRDSNVSFRNRRNAVSTWASWTVWSPCSRTCGGGVSMRTRNCITRYHYELNQLACLGDDRQFKACNWQACPDSSQSFRELQCSLHNGRDVLGQVVNDWVPYLDGNLPCVLQCYSTEHWIYYNFGKVLDGTPCSSETLDMCIAGNCVYVGCDGVLGSNKTEDMCRVCGGNGEECNHHKYVYQNDFPPSGRLGYNEITKIPKGATHIEIMDKSRNYLAIMENEKYILNGDWMINWPGKYVAAGTSLYYERTPDDHEKIIALGPTDEDIHVMVLFRERNPGVEYQYWLPQSLQTLHLESVNLTRVDKEGESSVQGAQNSLHQENGDKSSRQEKRRDSKRRKKPGQRRRRGGSKSGKKKCKCKKVRGNLSNHFCQSNFVAHIKVLSKRTMEDSVRIDASITRSYRNSFSLMHREFLWVPGKCQCPNLQTGKDYLVMGALSSSVSYESRLQINASSYVRSWTQRNHRKIEELQIDNSCND
ncbi:ADAMTS-like protein 5 isoform X2 [Ptychodera flava]|uniref:ADAMTS-like protein 5 isoform X2 n=1 Tax=Ptychodera flava TaxID=63121 RepID=UPI00396A7090